MDIACAVSVVSQFMHEPNEEYPQAVQRILQYLKATPRRGLLFEKGERINLEPILMETMRDLWWIENL